MHKTVNGNNQQSIFFSPQTAPVVPVPAALKFVKDAVVLIQR